MKREEVCESWKKMERRKVFGEEEWKGEERGVEVKLWCLKCVCRVVWKGGGESVKESGEGIDRKRRRRRQRKVET